MIRDNYLDMNKIIQDKKVLKLFRVVESHGGALRFVGGAVRDALAGLKGFDLDRATDLSPDELVEACSENGLRTVPIGIKFGTVGVIINDKVLEVTLKPTGDMPSSNLRPTGKPTLRAAT